MNADEISKEIDMTIAVVLTKMGSEERALLGTSDSEIVGKLLELGLRAFAFATITAEDNPNGEGTRIVLEFSHAPLGDSGFQALKDFVAHVEHAYPGSRWFWVRGPKENLSDRDAVGWGRAHNLAFAVTEREMLKRIEYEVQITEKVASAKAQRRGKQSQK